MVGRTMNIQEISKGEDIIVIEGATKRYAENVALNDVSLNIKKGRNYCVNWPKWCRQDNLDRKHAWLEAAYPGLDFHLWYRGDKEQR